MDKLERLMNLTTALLATEVPLSADELRDRIGGYPDAQASFHRSFERDKEDLRAIGLPLRLEPIPATDPPREGYRILSSEYAGRELRLEPDELAALHLATSIVRLDGGETGLHKLGGIEPSPDRTDDAEVGHIPFDDALAVLIAAAAERHAVTFDYGGTVRTVEPWRLSFARGHWYLAGWDRVRDGERLYRVDRIKPPITRADPATQPIGEVTDPGDLRGWELGDGDPIRATVRIDADQAALARQVVADVTNDKDGGVVAVMEVRNVDAFRSFVLSFLEHAEVLEPAELRADIVAWLEALR